MNTEQYLKSSGAGRPVHNDPDWVEKTMCFNRDEVPPWLKLRRGYFNVAPQIDCRLRNVKKRAGKAYQLALQGFMNAGEEWTLVHGETSGPIGHHRMGHAWLERDGWVYDPVLDRVWSWDIYARFVHAVPTRRYSKIEMWRKCAETRHCGPW